MRRTSSLVFARIYLETGDTHQAEDLLQETLLTAFRTLRQLAQPDKFRAWLLRIAQNVAIDAGRRISAQRRTLEREANRRRREGAQGPSPDEEMEQEELRQNVLAVLRSMPEEYRLPLTLRYLVGADYETIQMQTGLTNGSLRGLLHRGMKQMRAELQKVLGVEPVNSR
ncbi:MAG: sigma-70 family RNA polymerase sigma factor [Planctomycetes bacterium]|nr:sigma-70 family RNA polymerase sigma factor [Planctomycetota bacterium]